MSHKGKQSSGGLISHNVAIANFMLVDKGKKAL